MNTFLLVLLIQMALLYYSSANFFRMRSVVILNMVLISLLASKQAEVLGIVTNLSTVLFVGIVSAHTLLLVDGRKDIAIFNVKLCLVSLAAALGMVEIFAMAPVVPGNEESSAAISAIGAMSLLTVASSFIGFSASQSVLIWVFEYLKCRNIWVRAFIAQVACELVDSLVFYPTTCGSFFNGLLVKVGLTCLMLPLLMFQRDKEEL